MVRQSMNGRAHKLLFFCWLGLALGLASTLGAGAQEAVATNHQANAALLREVRHELAMLPHYTVFDWLQYQVSGYDVTLSGQVAVAVNKDDAERAVKGIEGVGKVTNNIEILPVSPMDDQIRRAEYRAIFGFANLGRYSYMAIPSIHVIVKGGHVTLEGIVDNEMDKNDAGIRAKGVPDVFSVTNNLRVQEYTAEPKGK